MRQNHLSYDFVCILQGSYEVIAVAASSVVTAVSDMAPDIVASEFPLGAFLFLFYPLSGILCFQ